ncbi:hypothetical protein [Prosthecobacter sp.]|uniref:hypothetical protein n=1 Tax=Prosthecobacter sp. TaxID=1965333 RepID=UPI003783BC48
MWRSFFGIGILLTSVLAAEEPTALRLVADLNPGRESAGFFDFYVWGGQVWFVAGYDQGGKSVAGLYRSDGSTGGTKRIKDIPWQAQGSRFDNPFVFENRLYFQGPNAGLGKGSRVWVTDGTEAGTRPISEDGKDVCDIYKPFLIGDRLVLSLHGDYDGHGLVALNLHTGKTETLAVPFSGWEDYTDGAMLDGAMLKLDLDGKAFWSIDGTRAGMKKLEIKGLPSFEQDDGFHQLLALPNGVLMIPNGSRRPVELWHTDGKSASKLAAFEWSMPAIPSHWLGRVGDRAILLAEAATRRCALWASDGTAAGTSIIWDSDPYKDAAFSHTQNHRATPVLARDRLYFTMDDGKHGMELWVSDGTKSGTHLVTDIALGNEDADIFELFPLADGRALAQRKNGRSGTDLWITDGTDAGSLRLATFNRSTNVVAVLGGMILVVAESDAFGRELHALDVPALLPAGGSEAPAK